MRLAPCAALAACIVLTGATARAAAPAPSLAAARAAVEKARADAAKAMQRASADSPTTADLDAAHAALGALKDALDAGTPFEADDLEYAKLVLAVRKELRTGRELVDDRRAKVYIFDQ